MLSGGAIAAMTGSDVENGEYVIRYTDTITVQSNGGTTTETAIGTTGNEIAALNVKCTAKVCPVNNKLAMECVVTADYTAVPVREAVMAAKKIPCRVCGKLFEPCAYCKSHGD